LVQGWKIVDTEQEDVHQAIWRLLEPLEAAWVQNGLAVISKRTPQEETKLRLRTIEPASKGHATASVTALTLPSSLSALDLGERAKSLCAHTSVEAIAIEHVSGVKGLGVARLTLHIPADSTVIRAYQYFYVRECAAWALTLGVAESEWSEYKPTFVAIAESFVVN
jgi:hypothetical protein